MTVDAAPVLYEVAKSSSDKKYKIRSLRGYIRFPRQFPMPTRERVVMAHKALVTAIRAEEQQLVLEVLERYPSGDTLRLAETAAEFPEIRKEAERVAGSIAKKLGGPSVTPTEMLEQAGRKPIQIEILKAVYGAGDKQKDVTELLRHHVGFSPVVGLPEATYNENFGGDPAPGAKKVLHVQYRLAGKSGDATFNENAPLMLPVPE